MRSKLPRPGDRACRAVFGVLYPIVATAGLVLVCSSNMANAQSGGAYAIKKSTIDGGGIIAAAGGAYVSSGTAGQPDAVTIAGGVYVLIGGFWSPAMLVPDVPSSETPLLGKVRHLSFVVPQTSASAMTALRVELTSLHHPSNPPTGTPNFAAFEGQFRYVNSFFGGTLCVDSFTFESFYRCGRLGCEPEYRDWAADLTEPTNPPSQPGLIHVTGEAVVPSSTYHVSHIAASCGSAAGANVCAMASAPLAVSTSRWGDVAGSGGGPPDGIQNVLDIGQVVDNVKGITASLPEVRAWLKNPTNVAGVSVNVVDIGLVVDSVKGFAYPYSMPACP